MTRGRTTRDEVLAAFVRYSARHRLRVFFPAGVRRGREGSVVIKLSTLAESHGDLTIAQMLQRLRCKRTKRPPSRVLFVVYGRNGEEEVIEVWP